MALVKTFNNEYQLQKEFIAFDRDYYTLDGYRAILDYFEECGCTTELDVIAICGDFNEESIEDIYDNYSNLEKIADTKDSDGDINESDFMETLNYYTYAEKLSNGNILYISF